MRRSILLRLRKLRWRNEDGSISVEFILTFPLLALWFLGSFVFFDAYRSLSQTEKVAFAVSDAASLYSVVTDSDLQDFWLMADKMLPRRSTERAFRISSICLQDDTYRVMWSFSESGSDTTIRDLKDSMVGDVPVDLMPAMTPGDSIILTEVYASWVPVTEGIFGLNFREQRWVNRLTSRPRFPRVLPNTDRNANNICPADDENVFGAPDPNGGGTPAPNGGISVEAVDLTGGNPDDD